MNYVLLLLLAVAILCALSFWFADRGGLRSAFARVTFAALMGTAATIASTAIARALAVGGAPAVPLATHLVVWAAIAAGLFLILMLFDLVAGRRGPVRSLHWLVIALAAIGVAVEAAITLRSGGFSLWRLVDFGAVAAVAAFAWWTGLPRAAART